MIESLFEGAGMASHVCFGRVDVFSIHRATPKTKYFLFVLGLFGAMSCKSFDLEGDNQGNHDQARILLDTGCKPIGCNLIG